MVEHQESKSPPQLKSHHPYKVMEECGSPATFHNPRVEVSQRYQRTQRACLQWDFQGDCINKLRVPTTKLKSWQPLRSCIREPTSCHMASTSLEVSCVENFAIASIGEERGWVSVIWTHSNSSLAYHFWETNIPLEDYWISTKRDAKIGHLKSLA